jgi:ubiquinone/menaquinone biosynthesis C-methylase UbiE
LDCGAGGDDPPLALFARYGYRTCGVEIALPALHAARAYGQEHDLPLNIWRGDMRHLPFADASFSHVYAYNAIMFMTKPDVARAMAEMARVLRPGGLLYVNFMSVDDPDDSLFCPEGPAQDLLGSERFAKHGDSEPDAYLLGFQILRREKRYVGRQSRAGWLDQVDLEYIARKTL